MKTEEMLVFVYELPRALEGPEARRHEREQNSHMARMDWGHVKSARVLLFDRDRIMALRKCFAEPETVLEATKDVLRALGSDGEAYLADDYRFLWDHALFGEYGVVHVLHVFDSSLVHYNPQDIDTESADGRCVIRRVITDYGPIPTFN